MGGADEDAPLTGGSLCSGSGGLDLGLERALGVDWRWHCEKDDAASKILAVRWPGVPNHGDLFDTDWSQVERVDLVAAGFPCPDYSLAGRRAGIDGEHGQVWIAVAAAVRALRPRYLVLENVDGIRSAAGPLDGAPGESAVGVVLADLADLGYRWAYDRLGASDVGAPHRRLRWFLAARLSAADALGDGVDADRRLRRGASRASRPDGSAPPAMASGQEVDGAADALADGPGTPADAERGRREQHDEGERDVSVAREGGTPDRLLPTPTAGDGDASGSRNLEGSEAHAGVSLTDAVQTGDSRTPRLLPTPTSSGTGNRDEKENRHLGHGPTLNDAASELAELQPVRLLPTPQAADGDGGRQEKGAMAHAGVRPSGHKATLPLPTAVSMRDELTETPFARPDEVGQLDLLAVGELGLAPCGCPWDDNVDAGGYCACCGAHLDDPDGMYALQINAKHFLRRCPLYGLPVGGLLPTPVANSENPGAGGELRAAIVHGEGRRNETGIDTLGRPNEGRPSRLLPTATAEDGERGRRGAGADRLGAATFVEPTLLPTPTTQDAENAAGPSQRDRNSDPLNVVAADALLPTPQTSNRKSRKAMTASVENGRRSGGGNSSPPGLEQVAEIREGRWPDDLPPYDELPPATRQIIDSLLEQSESAVVEWGVYGAAVRRWEIVSGRPAPAPTDEKGRLAPAFVEWMLGYPDGWFDVDGVSRTRKLRALGNSVQVQCAEAVGGWLAFLVESGLLT